MTYQEALMTSNIIAKEAYEHCVNTLHNKNEDMKGVDVHKFMTADMLSTTKQMMESINVNTHVLSSYEGKPDYDIIVDHLMKQCIKDINFYFQKRISLIENVRTAEMLLKELDDFKI